MASDLDRRLGDKFLPRVPKRQHESGWPEHEAAALAPWEALGRKIIRAHNEGYKFPQELVAEVRELLPDEPCNDYTGLE